MCKRISYTDSDYKQHICDVLHDLVPVLQFKKHEKYPWRSTTFSKVAGLKPFNTSKINRIWQDRIIILLVHQC